MAEETLVPAAPPPALNLPTGNRTVSVKIINSTTYVSTSNIGDFMTPLMKGHERLSGPCYSFLIEHEENGKTRRILFDLGMRKDWQNFAPVLVNYLSNGWAIHSEKNVAEILEETGVKTTDVEAIIWSHWHFDHIGDPSTFPMTTDLIVGPGFKDKLLPGYPADESSMILESDYAGRNLREIDFEKDGNGLTLGRFPAFDFFGDGSFYLLDAPGHAIGHICALARTTVSPPTFVLMGADSCHHNGEFRPSQYRPLPKFISPNPINPRKAGAWPRGHNSVCPGSLFLDIHYKNSATKPFYEVPRKEGIVYDDAEATEVTMTKIQDFDAANHVFVVMAHDETIMDTVEFYPKTMNAWKEKGWAEETRWVFLGDLSEGIGSLVGRL